jgi:TP901 family phage tail tape measure protein
VADAQSNIRINVDTSIGIAEIKNLQRQIAELNAQLLQSGAQQARAAQNVQRNLINNINATGKFAANVKTISSTAESFTSALERNRLSMGEYFRYAGASTKTFGRLFRSEFDTIQKVAESRVKTIQTQFVKLGRDGSGALKAIAVRPLALDMENLSTRTAMAAQKQQLFNQLVKQGSTNLLNFGKNTQWAGRQLMVGFTIPLSIFATTASKAFMQMEEQAIKFKRVYGDSFTATEETDKMLKQVKDLANEFTKYGVAVEKTMAMAADAAAMGLMNADLLAQVNQATRLAVLGGVEQEQALETTISLMSAFGTTATELAGEIEFLNAVENQTITAIEDLTIAIPKAAPVIKQLGGDVQDLAFFLTAMKEGGINASEGANALKSGLASLINPTEKASQFLQTFGINLKGIVEANKGDVKGTVVAFAQALDQLDPLSRARAIEQLFGKFQFARLSTLFQNVIKEGTQAQRVLQLTRSSSEELAILAERELRRVEESPMFKFRKAVEDIKVSLVPLGEAFLKAITPVAEFAKTFLDRFNSMSDEAKNFAVIATTVVAGIGPILLMTFGLIANGVANLIKMFTAISNIFRGTGKSSLDLGMSTEYMTQQQLEAAAVAASLDQSHSKLIQTFGVEARAVNNLAAAYGRAVVAQSRLLGQPIGRGGGARPPGLKLAKGIVSVPGPKGAGDVVPAMLSPGEAVIPAKQSEKYAGLIQGMINDNIPGFRIGRNPFASMLGRSRVGVRMSKENLVKALMDKNPRYKSAFETGTGADYLTSLGLPNKAQADLRSKMEQSVMGIPGNANASRRPTYGFAYGGGILNRIINVLLGGQRGRRFNAITGIGNDALSRYGDLSLITKRGVGRRSTAFAGDTLLNYSRNPNFTGLAPMSGASSSQLSRAGFGALNRPGGQAYRIGNGNMMAVNPKVPFIETQTPGGFGLNEVSRIVTNDSATAKQLQKIVKEAGLNIRVTSQNAPLVIRALSSILGTRFNEGTTGVMPFNRQSSQEKQIREIVRTLKEKLRSAPSAISMSKEAAGLTYGSLKKEDELMAKVLKAEILKETPNIAEDKLKAKLRNMLGTDLAHLAKSERVEAIAGQQFRVKNWDVQNLRKEHRSINQLFQHMADAGSPRGSFLTSLDPKTISAKYGIPLATVKRELPLLVNGVHPGSQNAYKVYGAIASEYGKPNGKAVAELIKFRLADKSAGSYFKAMSEDRLSIKTNTDLNQRALRSQQARIGTAEKKIFGITGNKNIPFSLMANEIGTSRTSRTPKINNAAIAKQKAATKTQALRDEVALSTILAGGKRSAPAMRSGRGGLLGMMAKLFGFRFNTGVVSVPGPKGKGDVVPAMLSPGEAVIPTKMAEKYAPLINGMISNSIPGYEDGLPAYQDSSGRWRDSSGRFARPPEQQQRSPRVSGMGGKVAGGASLAGMGAMMYGMSGMPGAEIAGMASLPLMMAPMLMPMLKNPAMAIVAGMAALGVTIFALSEQFKKTTKESFDLAMATGSSSKALEGLAETSGNVTAGQIMDRRRQQGADVFQTREGKTGFGESFLQSEAGKQISDSFAKVFNERGRATAIETITNQMATAVASGALDPGQARDIVAALGKQMDDYSFSIEVNSRLLTLLGPNGENLLKDPLKVRLDIISQSQQNVEAFGKVFSEEINLSIANGLDQGGFVGTAAASGAIIGGAIGLAIAGPLGAAIGGVVGGAGAGLTSFLGTQEQFNASAEAIGGFVASSAIALQNQQEMLDSLQLEYEQRIANAKAQGDLAEATRLEAEYTKSRNTLLLENKNTVEAIQSAFASSSQQQQILNQYKAFTQELFKEDPLMSGVLKGLESQISALDDETEVVIRASLLSGDLSPTTLQAMLSGDDFEKNIELFVKLGAAGTAQAKQIQGLFAEGSKAGKEFADKLLTLSPADAEKYMNQFNVIIQTLSAAGEKAVGVGLEFFFANPELLEVANEDIEAFKAAVGDKPITLEVIQQVYGQEMVDKIVANQDYFNSLPDDQKIVYTTVLRIVGEMDQAAKQAMAINAVLGGGAAGAAFKKMTGIDYRTAVSALGQGAADRIAVQAFDQSYAQSVTQAGAAKPAGSGTPTGGPAGGGGTDPIKNILERLKQVRDASIDAAGGASRLLSILGAGKDIKIFDGLEQQLSRFGKEFASFVTGLDANTRKRFVKIGKDGVVALTKVGQAARKAFIEASLGEFQLNLVQSIQHMENQQRALEILEERGVQYADAIAIATDETLALAIATGAISTEELERIIQLVTQLRSGQERASALDNLRKQINEFTKEMEAKKEIKLRYSPLEQAAILNDDTLMALAKLGEFMSEEFSTRLQQVMGSIEFKESIFQDGFNKAMEAFEAQEVQIELDFAMGTNLSGDNPALVNLTELNEEYAKAQNNVDILNFQIDDFEAGLKEIEDEEEKINDVYDKRLDALDEVVKNNDRILQQQKSQLTIADALSKGDIAAAARAVQDMRAQESRTASEDARTLLERSREQALEKLTNAQGLTREQIEKRIKDLKDQIFGIEEKTLEVIGEQIRQAEYAKQLRISEVTVLGRSRLEWEAVKNRIDIARTSSEAYRQAMQLALDVVEDIVNYWNGLESKTIYLDIITRMTTQATTSITSRTTAGTTGSQTTAGTTRVTTSAPGPATSPAPTQRPIPDRLEPIPTPTQSPSTGGVPLPGTGVVITPTSRPTGVPLPGTGQVVGTTTKPTSGIILPGTGVIIGTTKAPTTTARPTTGGGAPGLGVVARAAGGLIPYKRMGGLIPYKANGGLFKSINTDTVPAMLTPGEFVIRRFAVEKFGADNLKAINNGTYNGESVYNYSVNVSVQTDANPDQIARAVMSQIKQIDSQRIRGNRF